MLSPVFRVRDYEVQDCFPFSIGFSSDKVSPDSPSQIGSFTIRTFQISHAEAACVKVRVQLNLHGIVTIDSASDLERIAGRASTYYIVKSNSPPKKSEHNGSHGSRKSDDMELDH
ncbi:heat shock 70 kDa protein 16-like [Raphanus sativus]|nr:heat shock 70 kDa protein 16-like [Raphanus sativus]